MDLQQEITRLVRQSIMEEINNLAVRATIREKIEAAGVTQEDVRELVRQTADSYFRSAMDGNVEEKIRSMLDDKIAVVIDKEIKTVLNSFNGWRGSDKIKSALDEEAARAIRNGFEVSVTIKPKAV